MFVFDITLNFTHSRIITIYVHDFKSQNKRAAGGVMSQMESWQTMTSGPNPAC